MERTVLVVLPVEPRHKKILEESAPFRFCYACAKDVTEQMAHSAEVVIGNLPPQLLQGSAALRWVQLNSAGTDGYTSPGVLGEGVQLTNATGAYGQAVAEHLFAVMLMLQKKLHRYRDHQNRCEWADEGCVQSIADRVVLVVGLGDIGRHFAGLAKALGARVIGIRRTPGLCPKEADEVYTARQLGEQLGRADVVAAFLPGSAQTQRLFDAQRFAQMKEGALFLNAGRGNAVDQTALLEALRSGKLVGAGLDVTDPEPLPPEHPLWREPNVVITPHVSGGYHLPETFERIVAIAAENLRRYAAGQELRNLVDFQTGYCRPQREERQAALR